LHSFFTISKDFDYGKFAVETDDLEVHAWMVRS